jgi:hypothetical protein
VEERRQHRRDWKNLRKKKRTITGSPWLSRAVSQADAKGRAYCHPAVCHGVQCMRATSTRSKSRYPRHIDRAPRPLRLRRAVVTESIDGHVMVKLVTPASGTQHNGPIGRAGLGRRHDRPRAGGYAWPARNKPADQGDAAVVQIVDMCATGSNCPRGMAW